MTKKIIYVLLGLSLIIIGSLTFRTFPSKKTPPSFCQKIRISFPDDIRSLDPRVGIDNSSPHVIKMLFDGLFRRGLNGDLEPAIAKSYTVSKDGKIYTFHLRPCQWSDGEEVTAYDFEYAWKKSVDPHAFDIRQGAFYFYTIKNAEACVLGEASADDVGIYAKDSKTLVIELENPVPYFLELTASSPFYPVPKHIAEKNEQWGLENDLVCNGPFKLRKWVRNDKIKVRKNPLYWDSHNVQIEKINIKIIKDEITAFYLFEKGELDWIGSPLQRISCDVSHGLEDGNHFHSINSAFMYWFFVNTERYPLNNKKLRQALCYAIDRNAIVYNVFDNLGEPALSVLSPVLSVQDQPYFNDDNVWLAKRLFKEALHEMGITQKELPDIHLSYVYNSEIHHRIAQAVQDNWRKVFGIQAKLERAEWHVHYDNVSKGNYDLGFMGWFPSAQDPILILQIFKNKIDQINKSNWQNSTYRDLLDLSDQSIDLEKRRKLLAKAETILMEQMPVIPICSLKRTYGKNPKLKKVLVSALENIDFKYAYLEE